MSKITLNHITKIEGHASLTLNIDKGKITKCELGSTEGARFFEGLVVGKKLNDSVQMTSRICGICSTGHLMASLKAFENALGLKASKQTEILRELMTIGERIRSHATHLYFLALPDYLGYDSAIDMAPKYKTEVKRALELIKLGNDMVYDLGGRQMHAITCVIGGFTHFPNRNTTLELRKRIKSLHSAIIKTIELFYSLNYPNFEHDAEYVCLSQPKAFPLLEGDIVSSLGYTVKQEDYTKDINEFVVEHSTAKFSTRKGNTYLLGALARVNNCWQNFDPETKKIMKRLEKKVKFPSKNPFHNNVAQALEILHWTNRAYKLLNYNFKPESVKEFKAKKAHGCAAVEVPRGLLFHEYWINQKGEVEKANIMTPTCQFLANTEKDIASFVPTILNKKKDDIIMDIEKLIRAHDPCFSCSTHFLKVDWKQT